jgi:hypothetical protein
MRQQHLLSLGESSKLSEQLAGATRTTTELTLDETYLRSDDIKDRFPVV